MWLRLERFLHCSPWQCSLYLEPVISVRAEWLWRYGWLMSMWLFFIFSLYNYNIPCVLVTSSDQTFTVVCPSPPVGYFLPHLALWPWSCPSCHMVCITAQCQYGTLCSTHEIYSTETKAAFHKRQLRAALRRTDCLILLYSHQSMCSLQSDGKHLHPKYIDQF